MSGDLILNSACSVCGSATELYGSNCKHLTLCIPCGKSMAENRTKCFNCGATVTRLIRSYNVRASNKNYSIGRFSSGLPDFSKQNKWSIQKDDGLQGLNNAKNKNKPWVIQDRSGQFQYHGVVDGAPSPTYYVLMLRGKEFVAIPAGCWYNFNKVAHYYKQLSLEEAEEMMENRTKTAGGYGRWMVKAAANNVFGEVEKKFDGKESGGGGGGRGCKKTTDGDDGEDMGEEDEEEESEKRNRFSGSDDEQGRRGGDFGFDDDDFEKGDDWEHEEVFTDDDERVENDPEVLEDLGPAPPEIKQDDEDEEKEGGLSNSGKELKRLLGRSNGLNESDAEDDDDDYDYEEDEFSACPVLAPKQKDAPKEEPVDNSPLKPIPSAPARRASSTSKSAKGKRKVSTDDAEAATVVPFKRAKTGNDVKPEEPVSTSKKNAPKNGAESGSAVTGPVTEEEIRAVLTQEKLVTTKDLVAKFNSRLRCKEDQGAFALLLKRISKIHKTTNGKTFVVLR